MSIAIYVLIVVFTITRFLKMASKDDPIVYEVKQAVDLIAVDAQKYKFDQSHFTAGFRLRESNGFGSEHLL